MFLTDPISVILTSVPQILILLRALQKLADYGNIFGCS